MTTATARPAAGPDWLDAKLKAGAVVIIDGGMGTELEARGVPMDAKAWSAGALLEHGDAVRAAHVDFIRAGAEVVITNTFAAGRHMLAPAGHGDQVAAINRRAVQLAREAIEEAAADHPVAVAGSVCEWVYDKDSGFLEPARHHAALAEQADLLAEAGVDLIALEMCERPDHSLRALEAALATGLPVWAGCSCAVEAETGRVHSFDRPDDDFEPLIAALASQPVGLFAIMHSAIADTDAGLEILGRYWDGPVGVYPESGDFIMPNWQFVDIVSPDHLAQAARAWRDRGVQLFGGCCGLGPDHVRALKAAFA